MTAFWAIQEVKALLEKAESGDCRAALLRFTAAFSMRMSPRGVDTDVRHILVLVLLVGRLDDPDSALRSTAAQLLIGEALYPPRLSSHVSSGTFFILVQEYLQIGSSIACEPAFAGRFLQ